MKDMRSKFIADAIAKIEEKYSHLNDRERNDLIIFKNAKKLSSHQYNRLMELSERCKVKY